jgi:hypothetical protein
MALSLRERSQKRMEGLKKSRQPYEDEYREIASLAQPAKSRWLSTDTNKNVRQRNKRLNSSHGIFAFRTLQGGMTSGLSSPSRPWMRFGLHDEELSDAPDVRAWLDEVEKRMYGFLASTNFYAAVKSGYLELGMFGTEACVMVEHRTEGAVCHQLTAGEYWIGLGSALTPEALYRRCPLTVIQVMQRFEETKISPRIRAAYDRSNYEDVCDIYQAIEINDEYDDSAADARGKKFRSVYWDADHGNTEVLSISGFEEQPFWAPRWETTGGDAYGNGPGHDALPDLRELQLQAKRKGEATDHVLYPEMISPAKIKLKRQPKSVVSAASLDAEKVIVPYELPWQVLGAVAEDVQRLEQKVNEATYADLFMAITNMQGVQPRNIEEIAARNEEKLTQLGPVIERVNNEKLEVAIDRTFGIMSRMGLLPPAPDAVREAGGELRTEFVSILTQMQRMVGLGQIERTVGFIGSLTASSPEALDKLDVDEAIDEYADRAGAPPKLIRSKDAVEEIRAQRAQQQNMDRMIAAAPAVKDGADAAATMAETSQGAMPIAGAMPL